MYGKIKKALFPIPAAATLLLSGCTVQDAGISQGNSVFQETDTPQKDLTGFLYMEYSDYEKLYKKQTIPIGSYYMNESTIPDSRTVEFGYRSNTNFDNGKLAELTSDGIIISDDEIMFSAWNYFKKNDSTEITGLNSIDEIWQQYGQPLWYIEERETAVLVFEVFDPDRSYYAVFYGKNSDYKMIEVDKDKKFSIPFRPQVTDEKIFLFTESMRNDNSLLVTAIDLDGQEAELYTITYADMGLPDDTLIIHPNNIFIDGNVMFLYANDYRNTGYIALYDFKMKKVQTLKSKMILGMVNYSAMTTDLG